MFMYPPIYDARVSNAMASRMHERYMYDIVITYDGTLLLCLLLFFLMHQPSLSLLDMA
jgi:hypothetical protein